MFKYTQSPEQQYTLITCHCFAGTSDKARETSDKAREIDECFRSCCAIWYTSAAFVLNVDSKQKELKEKRYNNSSYLYNSMCQYNFFHVYGDEFP